MQMIKLNVFLIVVVSVRGGRVGVETDEAGDIRDHHGLLQLRSTRSKQGCSSLREYGDTRYSSNSSRILYGGIVVVFYRGIFSICNI